MKAPVGYKPNVVMINGGTNDADLMIDIPNAGSRMEEVLDVIWNTPDAPNPDACVILSTLLPTSNTQGSVQSPSISKQYADVAALYRAMGKCIYLADLRVIDPATGQTWIRLGADIGSDGIHPTDVGYQKMASIMSNGIMAAYKDGKIKEPQPVDLSVNKGCPEKKGDSVKIGGMTQLGSGHDDDIYHHDGVFQRTVLSINSSFDRDQWFTARLFSPDKHDILGWYNASETQHMFGVWKNTGTADKAAFEHVQSLDPDLFCNPKGVHFIDMNNDGMDDLVCINADGNAFLSINMGVSSGAQVPTFRRLGDNAPIMAGKAPQRQIRMADIDGDGRGDYCVIDESTGNIHVCRNGWVDDKPLYWQDLGIRATIGATGDIDGIRFANMKGSNGDDWLWVSDEGVTYT